MIIDCISDLHGYVPRLAGGDLLVIAGDLTARDTPAEYLGFYEWVQKLDYQKIILIGGNHDNFLQNENPFPKDEDDKVIFLCDSGTTFEGLKIWGTPWTKTFSRINPKCMAFTVDTEQELEEKFLSVPMNTDILITHGPPFDILDQIKSGYRCGSIALRTTLDQVKPKLLIFGHIHENGGKKILYKHMGNNTWCVNASIVNEYYEHVNQPLRVLSQDFL